MFKPLDELNDNDIKNNNNNNGGEHVGRKLKRFISGDDKDDRKTFSGHSTFADRTNEENLDSSLASVLGLEEINRQDDNVNVAIRVRPTQKDENGDEVEGKHLIFPGEGQIQVIPPNKLMRTDTGNSNKPKVFNYNVIFEPDTSQEDVFEHSGIKYLVDRALDGFSCTILAYGQTGSGKTFTLSGPPLSHSARPSPISSKTNKKVHEPRFDDGLMQRTFRYVFERLERRNLQNYVIKASYLEIYNEQIIDLLNPGQKKYLTVRWNKIQGFLVENLFLVECLEEDDVMAVLEEGLINRQVSANNVNETSSRSHCILTLHIDHEVHVPEDNAYIEVHGKIMFVDLAGSEKVHAQNTRGSRNETNKINRSLLTLGKCISALADEKKKSGHIPYRDSKLTKLLQESLEGKGFTLMIACISPALANVWETLNTLHYAARMKLLENQPIVKMDPREELIRKLRKENRLLKAENIFLKEKLKIPINNVRSSSAPQPAKNLRLLEKLKSTLDTGQTGLPQEVSLKEVYNVVHDYKAENDSLREENTDLLRTREFLIRDQELISRENERLAKKLEIFEGISNSPSSSGSISDMDGSTRSTSRSSLGRPPPHLSTPTRPPHRLPESISKELQRRRIGESVPDVNSTGIGNMKTKQPARRNSWDNGRRVRKPSPVGPVGSRPNGAGGNRKTTTTTGGNYGGSVRRSESDKNLAGGGHGGSPAKRQASEPRKLGLLDHV